MFVLAINKHSKKGFNDHKNAISSSSKSHRVRFLFRQLLIETFNKFIFNWNQPAVKKKKETEK